MKIGQRDQDFIETRLLAPCVDASDAHERMRKYTMTHETAQIADRLMYAMQEFTNTCRDIRREWLDATRS